MDEEIKTTDAPVADTNASSTTEHAAASSNVSGQEETTTEVATDGGFINPLTTAPDDVSEEPKNDKEEITSESVEYTDFIMPEGVQVDENLMSEFKPIAKELGLTQEQAQKLVDFQTSNVKKSEESFQNQLEDTKKELIEQTKKMLGANYAKELTYAAKAIDTLLPKETAQEYRELLDSSGLGNHPLMVKFAVEAGKKLSEDTFVKGNSNISTKNLDPSLNLGRNLIKK